MTRATRDDPFHVLFLCTGNSARSLLAEAILARLGGSRFRASSAGSHSKAEPHPLTIEVLRDLGYDTSGLRSKSWDVFAGPGAAPVDLVVTVCDDAAGEACPIWPGHPLQVHWGMPDPAAFEGSPEAVRRGFESTHDRLAAMILELVRLDPAELDRDELRRHLDAIGRRPST
jgi:arsenate reductase